METLNPTWTPDTTPDQLVRANSSYDFGPQRVYFYDLETRQELTDHPLNGMCWSGTGAMVSHVGRYVDGTTDRVCGTAYLDGKPYRLSVTAASFPGRKVCAKVWTTVSEPDWRILAKGDGSRVTAAQCKNRHGREWVEAFKRGDVA